jgi:hypothetical protein
MGSLAGGQRRRRAAAGQLRRRPLPAVLAAAALLAAPIAGCASQEGHQAAETARVRTQTAGRGATWPAVPGAGSTATGSAAGTAPAAPSAPATAPVKRVSSAPRVAVPGQVGSGWRVVATVREAPAAWLAQRGGVTLMRFEQGLAHLALHAGSAEPGGGGWPNGDQIGAKEVHRVIAGFNGGFKLTYGSVGFTVGRRVAVPLSAGLASIVTYADGTTNIGAWHEGVPARGVAVASVRQNLHLLVDRGEAAGDLECVQQCWGSTLGGGSAVPRSALGVDGQGRLVWAAGMNLTPASLAHGLVAAGVQRAVELDINPAWVAGYLYVHRSGGPAAVPVVPGQNGIAGQLLAPYSRDFFTVVAN